MPNTKSIILLHFTNVEYKLEENNVQKNIFDLYYLNIKRNIKVSQYNKIYATFK